MIACRRKMTCLRGGLHVRRAAVMDAIGSNAMMSAISNGVIINVMVCTAVSGEEPGVMISAMIM